MALKKIRFVWTTPSLPGGRWRAGLFNLQQLPDPARPAQPRGAAPAYWRRYVHHALHLSVRGLLLWGAGAALAAYFLGAAILLQRLERANSHNRVGYLDLVLPTRWSQLDRLRGEGFAAQGRELLRAGEFSPGFARLRLALAKNPGDHETRLDVARLYTVLRLRSQAEKLLLDGLAHGYPGREFLEFACALAADADRPDDWVELVRRTRAAHEALPEAERPAGDSLWLDQQLVRALHAVGQSAAVLALVERRYPTQHPFRREVTLVHLLENGRAAEAATLAEDWIAQEPLAPEPVRLLARARREAGDFAGLDAALVRLRALDPAKPEPLLYALVQNHLAGRTEAAEAALDELLFRHGASPAAYTAAAAVLGELKRLPQLERLERELRERGLPLRPVLQARLQLATAAREWSAVLALAEALRRERGAGFTEVQQAWHETVARLARAALDGGSGTQASLVEIVADRPGTLRLYTLLLEALLEAGRPETARQILTLAEGPYAGARSIVALRARIEEALEAAAPEPVGAHDEAPPELASAEALEAAFAACIRLSDTDGALALLASARRARPPWFSRAEARLDALELPVRARGDDPLRLQLLARTALGRDARATETLLALARQIAAEAPPHRAHALLLVKEILRHAPGHPEALSQLAVWEPRPGHAPLAPAP